MAKKKMRVSIPKPCNENWDKMKPVEQGRFCGSCQTPVVDFTNMNDAQLIAFFKRPLSGSVCGRMMHQQLDRDIDIPKKRIPWVRYFFQFALPAFLVSAKAAAQGQVVIKDTTVNIPRTHPVVMGRMTDPEEHEISGRIYYGGDDEEPGIPNILVSINGTSVSGITDSSGNFTIVYRGREKKLTLKIAGEGYDTKEKTIRLGKKMNAKKYVELPLAKEEIIVVTVGAIVTTEF